MMGYQAPSKKAIKDAIKSTNVGGDLPSVLDYWRNVQETSMFGAESRVPGENIVVGPDAYSDRRWYATLTVNAAGIVVGIR